MNCRWLLFVCLLGVAVSGVAGSAAAAEPQFVGVLALAVEGDMPQRLGLSEEQQAELGAIIERRETEALELVLQLENLPPEERRARLEPFRRESEQQGLGVLTPEQRTLLEQVRLQRAGMTTLNEPAVAESLGLSDEQRRDIEKILSARDAEMAGARRSDRDQVAGKYERQLAEVLDDKQRSGWDRLAGGAATAPVAVQTTDADMAVGVAIGKSEPAPPAQQPAAKPADVAAAEDITEVPAAGDGRLRFNFRYQPWAEVLDWFAEQADLSLILEAPPPGTFNYTDNRSYTPAEAIDLLNSVLLTKGYTLVRRDQMLILVNLEDGIPPNLVPIISSEELDDKGKYELVTTIFSLNTLSAQEGAEEIRDLIGPQGKIVVLAKSRQLQVTETGGRLRLIRSVLERADQSMSAAGGDMRTFRIENALPDEVLTIVRQLLDIPDGAFVSNDGSVRIAMDPLGSRLLVSGAPEKVQRVEQILQVIDIPLSSEDGGAIVEMPQLEVYTVTAADPNSVLQVLQTLMVNFPDVRLAIDPITGNLVALARPSQHATIRATIDQMQRDERQIEVIRLNTIDATQAMESINKLFGGGGETPSATAPQVEADPTGRQLLVRGSAAQIEQIRSLLEKMGETAALAGITGGTGNVRMLPYSSRTAQTVLDQMEQLWPALRPNKIRVVTPSAVIPTLRPSQDDGSSDASGLLEMFRGLQQQQTPAKEPPPAAREPQPGEDPSTSIGPRTQIQPAAWRQPEVNTEEEGEDTDAPQIIVAPGPGGIMIASQDTEALDEFEALFDMLASAALAGASQYTVFYLENADARVIAETLTNIFSGGVATGGGGSLLGDLAGAALGDAGGGLMGALLGLGGGGSAAPALPGGVLIVPETRLNALVVQGSPAEIDTIEQLLRVLDQPDAPLTQVSPRPKLIPVLNTSAAQIATIVKEVFQENMVSSGGQRQPSPEQIIQLLRGGRGGATGGGGSQRTVEDTMKMTVSVDARTNSLVVSAPQTLFEQVEELVVLLDQQTAETNQAIRVVAIKRGNPETVQKALTAITGGKVQTNTQSAGGDAQPSGQSESSQQQGGSDADRAREEAEQARRRLEFFNQIRERLQQGGGSSGGPGGGFPGGGFPGRGGSDGRRGP